MFVPTTAVGTNEVTRFVVAKVALKCAFVPLISVKLESKVFVAPDPPDPAAVILMNRPE